MCFTGQVSGKKSHLVAVEVPGKVLVVQDDTEWLVTMNDSYLSLPAMTHHVHLMIHLHTDTHTRLIFVTVGDESSHPPDDSSSQTHMTHISHCLR